VKNSLTRDALLTLIRALVVSKLAYCSSVLAGLPGSLMRRLQSVLNSAARLVYSARLERVTPLLRELHWLRVPERIQFRLCVLTYAAFMAAHHHTSLRHCLDTASDVGHGSTSSPAVRVYIEPNGPYIGRPGIPRGCGTSLELITGIRQTSVVISDIPALSEVAAVQCVFSRRLNITVLLLLCN